MKKNASATNPLSWQIILNLRYRRDYSPYQTWKYAKKSRVARRNNRRAIKAARKLLALLKGYAVTVNRLSFSRWEFNYKGNGR